MSEGDAKVLRDDTNSTATSTSTTTTTSSTTTSTTSGTTTTPTMEDRMTAFESTMTDIADMVVALSTHLNLSSNLTKTVILPKVPTPSGNSPLASILNPKTSGGGLTGTTTTQSTTTQASQGANTPTPPLITPVQTLTGNDLINHLPERMSTNPHPFANFDETAELLLVKYELPCPTNAEKAIINSYSSKRTKKVIKNDPDMFHEWEEYMKDMHVK